MLLIIQIGLGILLGFLLIQYHRQLGRFITGLAAMAILAGLLMAVGYAGHEVLTAPAITEPASRFWSKLSSLAVPLFCIIISAVGGAGAMILWAMKWPPAPRPTDSKDDDVGRITIFTFGNAAITAVVYSTLAWLTPLGQVGDAVERYSRAQGWADALPVVSFSLMTLWPWVVLLAIKKLRDRRASRFLEIDEQI